MNDLEFGPIQRTDAGHRLITRTDAKGVQMSSKRRRAEKREMQIGREYADEHEARLSLEGRPFALLGYDERMREIQQEREHPNGLSWYSMSTAPREAGESILLLHRSHGVIEGRFSKGEWSDDTPDHPREYSGSAWICGDDAFQEEVEEIPAEHGGYDDGEIIGWLPRDALPTSPEEVKG